MGENEYLDRLNKSLEIEQENRENLAEEAYKVSMAFREMDRRFGITYRQSILCSLGLHDEDSTHHIKSKFSLETWVHCKRCGKAFFYVPYY